MIGNDMSKLYSHFSKVDMSTWRWSSFSPQEIASKGEGELLVNEAALDKLQRLRDLVGKPLYLTSAYRSKRHNARVGGAKSSKHMLGEAFDIQVKNHDPHELEAAARKAGFLGFGYYPKSGFMHVDIGPARSWGTHWPKSESARTTAGSASQAPATHKPTPKPSAARFGGFWAAIIAWLTGKGRT